MKPYPPSSKMASLSESGHPQQVRTSGRRSASSLLSLTLFLALAPAALASTTWYVNGVSGSDNNNCTSPQTACKSIGHAISLASSGDSIMVAAATYTENLSIGFSLKLIGSSASTTIIDGGLHSTVVSIPNSSAHVALSRVTIRNGYANCCGGGINNSGTLTINNSSVSGNTARGKILGAGGGIFNSGTLTIANSTVSTNGAAGIPVEGVPGRGAGGGIFNHGLLTVNNSTISGNTAFGLGGANGGGIANHIYGSSGTLTINNGTLSENSAMGGANHSGGGISNGGTATLQNTIVADSPSGGNCDGTMASNGYNLSSDSSCNFNGTGDLNKTDPKLGQLGNYGGPTQTIPLLSGSPAIDAGNPNGCTDGKGHLLKTDQRGRPRPDKEDTGGCDMGAYERQKD